MYQNKIFCALSSFGLIIYCSYFRNSLPSIYIGECMILLQTSLEVHFRKNSQFYNQLLMERDQLILRDKLVLIDKTYQICRYFKVQMYLIIIIDVTLIVLLIMRSYASELLDNFKYIILDDLSLMYNVIFVFIYYLVSFPYVTKSFRQVSNIDWQYFRIIYVISKTYRYLQIVQALLLILLTCIKSSIANYFFHFFAFILFYQLSAQDHEYFIEINKTFKNKLIRFIQSCIQYLLIILFTLEYYGLPEFGLNSFSQLFQTHNSEYYDSIYLIILGLSFILSMILNLIYKVRIIKEDIMVSAQVDKNFEQTLITQRAIRERRSSIIFPEQDDVNRLKDISNQDQQSKSAYKILRILVFILQIYTILIVMTYPNVLFLFQILWLFQSSVTRQSQIVVNYLILIYIPSIIYIIQQCNIMLSDKIILWIQVLFSFAILRFQSTNQQEILENATTYQQKSDLNPIIQVVLSVILRNSYTVTLIIVFWITLFTANIIHTLLLLLTILFIIKHQSNIKSTFSFRHRHWIWMVCLVNIIIFLKYFYMLQLIQFDQLGLNVIELFGFQFDYHFPISLSFTDNDFGSLSILWILDFFVVAQYENYKSVTYKLLSKEYRHLIGQWWIISQIRSLYGHFYSNYMMFICYSFCLFILVAQRFNIINLIQIFTLLLVIIKHLRQIIYNNQNYKSILSSWNHFLITVGFMTILRYIYNFSWQFVFALYIFSLQLLQQWLNKYQFYQLITEYQTLIGLNKRIPLISIPNLLLDILVLCFGYLGQDYLSALHYQMMSGEEIRNEYEMKDLSQSVIIQQRLIQQDCSESQIQIDIIERYPLIKECLISLIQIIPIANYIIIVYVSIKYKICVSMLIYLLITFSYIYQNRSYFRELFQKYKINQKLNDKIIRWKYNFIAKVEKQGFHSQINEIEDAQLCQYKYQQLLVNQIKQITQRMNEQSIQNKRVCHLYVLYLSIMFLFMTYLSQVLKYMEFIDIKILVNIKYALFAFGTYTDYQLKNNFIFYDIYPYCLALLLVLIEAKCQQFVQNNTPKEDSVTYSDKPRPYILRHQELESQYLITNFYHNKYQLLKINCEQGLIYASERMYMMILFFLAATSEGVFCVIYVLLFALVFYQKKNQKYIINLVSIIVVIFQYLCYLITLSKDSSPRPFPTGLDSQYIVLNFDDEDLIDKLGLSGKGRSKGIFIFNCIIVFAIWLFYYFQEVLSVRIIAFIDSCYINYRINKNLPHISASYYITVRRLYIIIIVYFHLVVQCCVLFYYSIITYSQRVLQIINFIMFLITIVYLYYQEIYQSRPTKQTQSRIFFYKIFIIIQQGAILCIFVYLFSEKLIDSTNKISALSLLEIFVFYILQLALDLLDSREYYEITDEFYYSLRTRAELVGLAMSYDANNKKLQKLIERYKDRKNLKESVDQITSLIMELNQKESIFQQDDPEPTNYNPYAEPLRLTLIKWMENHRNRFLFEPSYQIFHYLACQNLQVLQILEYQIEKVQFQEYQFVLRYLDKFYKNATKYISANFDKEEFIESFQSQNRNLYYLDQDVKQIKQDWFILKQKISEQQRLINIKVDDIRNIRDIHLNRLLMVMFQFLLTFWHYCCFFLLIIYYFVNHGLITIMFPLLVFGYGIIEEQQPIKYIWQIAYIYLSFQSSFEILSHIFESYYSLEFRFLFGDSHLAFQFFILVCILIQVNIMKNTGIYEKLINQYETIYQSLLRNLFNGSQQNFKKAIKQQRNRLVRSKSQEDIQRMKTTHQAQQVSTYMNDTYSELQKLENNLFDYLTRIKQMKMGFVGRLFNNMKPGKDIYPFIAGSQIVIAIYIFLFYDQMKSMDSPSIQEILKYNQFSGQMVIALLFQIVCILLDRYIIQYRPNKKKEMLLDEVKVTRSQSTEIQQHKNLLQDFEKPSEQVAIKYKYYFSILMIALVNLFVMYQIRFDGCEEDCKFITTNIFMIIFYFLYSLYFFFSALQIKYGINDLRSQNTLMQGYKFHNFVIFKVYRLMPFLFEIRTLCDWAFSETSLTLFQWIKLEDIHSLLYLAKCNAYFFKNKKVGKEIPIHTKCSLGFCFILVLLGLLFGPIFLYSPLNPTLQNDNLNGAMIEVGLRVNQTNYYQLYINSHVSDIHQITDSEWSEKNFSASIEKDTLQIVRLTHFSDTYWDISYPSLQALQQSLKCCTSAPITLIKTYRFIREYTDQTQLYISDPYQLSQDQIDQIYDSIINCQSRQQITLNGFYNDLIRIDKNKQINIIEGTQAKPIELQLSCTTNNQFWWSIYSDDNVGMQFYIISDKYSSALLGYSLLGFYLTIVYVAGKLARGIMNGNVDLIPLQEMPYPDQLIQICEAITLARIEKDLVQEELLYFQLIDIIRSPQLLKAISGSFYQQRLNQWHKK